MMPHRPQTTDGTTASRSMTYTIGCDQRRGTTSVSSRATPTLTGTAMMIAITEVMTVPYRKAIAPNWLCRRVPVGGEDARSSPPW